MKLGFCSSILPDQELKEVLKIAADIGYECVEVMCWPVGNADRRYAGVTHIDLDKMDEKNTKTIHSLLKEYNIDISALGYYPNPLVPDTTQSEKYITHIKKMIEVAASLGLEVVNTFIGRDQTKNVDDNWPRFLEVWRDIIAHAENYNVKVGIENCPMIFTNDEWPGGQNLGTTPVIWDRMYNDIPSDYFGLNYDPSHMIWQHMDPFLPIREYSYKFFHVHAKDVRIDQIELDRNGIMAPPNFWHTPKIPGMGNLNWAKFFSYLTDSDFDGAVCVEVEDRSFEGSKESRIAALQQSYNYLKQFIPVKK
ncbi:MAG: sugar phosphate isomerase/epimerase family protein [Saprospiraceae bacterium]